MEALYLLIPMSIAVVFLAIWIFFRASDSGQFDDLVGPGMRVLQDDDRAIDERAMDNSATAAGANDNRASDGNRGEAARRASGDDQTALH